MGEHYTVSIEEQSYKSNYKTEEVKGTFLSINLNEDDKVFDTPQEALQYFYNNYRGDLFGICVFDDDNSVKYCISFIAYAGKYGFEPADEHQLKAWKKDKIDLYIVYYVLLIKKVEEVKQIDLSNLGFEVKQC